MFVNDDVRNQILQASKIALSASDVFCSLEPILNTINNSSQIQEIINSFSDELKSLSVWDNVSGALNIQEPLLSECIGRIDFESFASSLSDCARSIFEVISENPKISDPIETEKIAEKCEPVCDTVIKSLPEDPPTLISEFQSLSPLEKFNLIILILTLFFTAYSSVKPAKLPQPTVTNNYSINITVSPDTSQQADTNSDDHEPNDDMREQVKN